MKDNHEYKLELTLYGNGKEEPFLKSLMGKIRDIVYIEYPFIKRVGTKVIRR